MAPNLRARIAAALGWTESETCGFSLQALRELVRPTRPDLAEEVTEMVLTGAIVTIPTPARCFRCGRAVPAGAPYCPHCHASFND